MGTVRNPAFQIHVFFSKLRLFLFFLTYLSQDPFSSSHLPLFPIHFLLSIFLVGYTFFTDRLLFIRSTRPLGNEFGFALCLSVPVKAGVVFYNPHY